MATLTIKQLSAPVALTTTAQTIITAPTGATTAIVNGVIRFSNTTAGGLTVTAYAVPNGGSAGTSNAFLSAETVGANAHLDSAFPQLGPQDTLQALASGAGVTLSVLNGVIVQ